MSRIVRAIEAKLFRQLAAAAMRAGVRDGFSIRSVRRDLAESDLLRRDVQIWLTAPLESSVRRSAVPVLGALLAGETFDPETLRATRSELGGDLPTLHRWMMVGKVLGPLVRLQTEPESTVEAAARESPYAGTSGFRAACRTLFVMQPSEICCRLGWEWVLERFLGQKSG